MKVSGTNQDSFFGAQEGDFELAVRSISGFQEDSNCKPYRDDPLAEIQSRTDEKVADSPAKTWLGWMLNLC